MTGGCSRLRRFGTLLLALFVVAQPMVGSAAASSAEGPCDGHDGTGEYLLDLFGGAASDTVQYIAGQTSDDECYSGEEVRDIVANTSHADAYASTMYGEDLTRALSTIQTNHMEDSDAYALTLVEAEVVREMRNGSNLSEAKTNVSEVVDDYYSRMQLNVWRTQNSNLRHVWYLSEALDPSDDTDDNVPISLFRGVTDNGDGTFNADNYFGWENTSNSHNLIETRNGTLLNGSTAKVVYMDRYASTILDTEIDPFHVNSSTTPGFYTAGVSDPQTTPETTAPFEYSNWSLGYDEQEYHDLNESVVQTRDRVHANAMNFTEQVYANYNASDFEGIEVVSGITLYTQFNTDENSTGYYGYTAGKMGLMGIEGNINSSWTIEYTPSVNSSANGSNSRFVAGQTYNLSGTLYTDWDPNGATTPDFEVNQTYDTTTTNRTVMFIAQESNTSAIYTLEGNFTVQSLTNAQTGESLNNTSLRQQTRETFNSSYTIEDLRNLLEYRDSVYDVSETSSGGGGGFNFGGLSLGGFAVGGLVALGIALVVLGNGNPLSGS